MKRILAGLLCLLMCVALIPTAAAAEIEIAEPEEEELITVISPDLSEEDVAEQTSVPEAPAVKEQEGPEEPETVLQKPEYEINSISDAKAISFDTSYRDSLTSTSREKYYKFTLGYSGRIRLYADADINSVVYYLYDSSSNQVFYEYSYYDSVKGTNILDEDLDLVSGTYYLRVKGEYSSDVGSYTFSLGFTSANESIAESQTNMNNSISTADTVALNTSYRGQIAMNDREDFYKFTLNQSGRIRLYVDTEIDRVLYYLYDASSNQVFYDYSYYDSVKGTNILDEDLDLVSGTYYLRVKGEYSSHTGTYSFVLGYITANESFSENQNKNNNSISSAFPISINTNYIGQIARNDKEDYYSFKLASAATVFFVAETAVERIYYYVYNASGTEIKYIYSGLDSTTGKNLLNMSVSLTAGTYYFRVSRYNDNNTGPYSFAIVIDGWVSRNGNWYYYSNGVALTGWQTIDGKQYYFHKDGVMHTGWAELNNKKYFFTPSTGVMVKGWANLADGRYFFKPSNGEMVTGWATLNNKQYFFQPSTGKMLRSTFATLNGQKYYFKADGVMGTGLLLLSDGNRYYFKPGTRASGGGVLQTGWRTINGYRYFFKGSTGASVTGWAALSGNKYYFYNTGVMATGKVNINGKIYDFGSDGICRNP